MFLQGVTIACCGAEASAGEVTRLLAPSQMLPRIFGARTLRTRLKDRPFSGPISHFRGEYLPAEDTAAC